jgi:hypothetical protein
VILGSDPRYGEALMSWGLTPFLWERIIHRRMFDLIEDSNSYVRSSIIDSINEYNKKNANLRIEFKKMLAILKRDRHYKLRNQVLSIR